MKVPPCHNALEESNTCRHLHTLPSSTSPSPSPLPVKVSESDYNDDRMLLAGACAGASPMGTAFEDVAGSLAACRFV